MPLTLNKEKVYECIQKYGAADPRVRGAVASRSGGSGSFIVLAGSKHIVFIIFGGQDGEREEVRVVETKELEEVMVKKKLFGSEIRLVMKNEAKMSINIHNLAQNAWQSEVIDLFSLMSEGLKGGLSMEEIFKEENEAENVNGELSDREIADSQSPEQEKLNPGRSDSESPDLETMDSEQAIPQHFSQETRASQLSDSDSSEERSDSK